MTLVVSLTEMNSSGIRSVLDSVTVTLSLTVLLTDTEALTVSVCVAVSDTDRNRVGVKALTDSVTVTFSDLLTKNVIWFGLTASTTLVVSLTLINNSGIRRVVASLTVTASDLAMFASTVSNTDSVRVILSLTETVVSAAV